MIRLAFSTNAFKKNTLPEAVDLIAAVGYRGMEVMADVPHADPFTFDEARHAALVRQVDSLGLTVSNVNAFTGFACGDTYHPTWIEHDPARRQWRVDHATAAVDLAFRLGCGTVSLQPGGPLIGTGLSREEASERFAAGLRQVLPAARKVGVTLAVEPEPGLLIQTAAEYLAFKREFFAGEPLVKMNCDVGHLFCVGDDPGGGDPRDAGGNRPRPFGRYWREPRPPAFDARSGGDRLPADLRRAGGGWLRRVGDGGAVPV